MERCKTCGFHIRGKMHDKGPHHNHYRDMTGKRAIRNAEKLSKHGKQTNVGDPNPKHK